MLVKYVSSDAVNCDLASKFGQQHGVGVAVVMPAAEFVRGDADGVVFDLDFQLGHRANLLHELTRRPAALPTVVHAYNLSGEETRALRRQGVHVCERLAPVLFRRLAAVLRAAAAASGRAA